MSIRWLIVCRPDDWLMTGAAGRRFRAIQSRFRRKALAAPPQQAQSRPIETNCEESKMLQQIVSHTPAYVWVILGLLVYRGVAASRDRRVPVRQVFILPAVMLVLGLQSTANGFGLESPAGAAWLAGLAAGLALIWRGAAQGAVLDRASGMVYLRGSWLPMALMMTIFVGKFAMAVALASQPALCGNLAFAVPACAAFGALSGAFMARPLRMAAALRSARAGAISAA